MNICYTKERAELCASLHNELLALTASKLPEHLRPIQGALIDQIQHDVPNYFVDHPNKEFLRMLSVMDWYPALHGIGEDSQPVLVPFAPQHDRLGLGQSICGMMLILQCGFTTVTKDLKIGNSLSFDPSTRLTNYDVEIQLWENKTHWIPLEAVLRFWLTLWRNGEFIAPAWITSDLDRAIRSCEALLTTIEERTPGAIIASRLDPIERTVLDLHHISDFSREFLARAQRPKFKYIAPGVTAFSAETFNALYSAETPALEILPCYAEWMLETTSSQRRTTVKTATTMENWRGRFRFFYFQQTKLCPNRFRLQISVKQWVTQKK